jgi:hypothetical protein
MPTYSHQAPCAYSLVCAHPTSPRAHPRGLVGCSAARIRNSAHHDPMRTTPCETAAAPMHPLTPNSCAASAASRTAGPKAHRFLSSHLVNVYHQYEHGVATTKVHNLAWSIAAWHAANGSRGGWAGLARWRQVLCSLRCSLPYRRASRAKR